MNNWAEIDFYIVNLVIGLIIIAILEINFETCYI